MCGMGEGRGGGVPCLPYVVFVSGCQALCFRPNGKFATCTPLPVLLRHIQSQLQKDNSSVALHGCISEQQQQQQQQRRQLLRWTGHRSTAAHHTSPRHQHHVQGPLRVGPHQPTRCMCLQTLTVPGGACVRVRGVVASTGWKTAMHGGKADLLIGTYAQRRHCKQFVTPSSFPSDAVVDAVLGAGRGPGVRAPRTAWTAAVPTVPPGSHPVFFELNIQVRLPTT